jgi:hypothetical protein
MTSGGTRLAEVDGEATKSEFKRLKEILNSCYGPWGKHILLRSKLGGVVTHTKRTLKLLQLMKSDSTLVRNAVLHLQGHAQCYRDSTLYAGMLTCK